MPRALISVSDKTGLEALARGLRQAGFQLLSTGGTRRALSDLGIESLSVSEVTGFPEILDGRVKTLHPRIHGGVLARQTVSHRDQLREHGIEPIDVVVVNLYPFRQTVSLPGVRLDEAVEQIDIGGPTLIRAAAKNHERVWVVVDPADYRGLLAALEGEVDEGLRRRLALKAFRHTASYDAAIAGYLERQLVAAETEEALPPRLVLELERAEELRYGENPHQRGARYRQQGLEDWWEGVISHKGERLSYLNVWDAEAAWRLAHELSGPSCVIVKHANPCGAARARTLLDAYARAFEADPKSAFGGVVAFNERVDRSVAEAVMANPKADVLIAPSYDEEALEILRRRRKAMRVLEAPRPGGRFLEFRRVGGGFLVQEPDLVERDRASWQVPTRAAPPEGLWPDIVMAWTVCAYTSSNAIVLVRDGVAVGIGAGQQSRVDAAELATGKAAGRAQGGVCASDAFFPFRDGVDAAVAAGVSVIIQPGGSVRDSEVVAAADEHGVAMVLTGRRHFRH